MPPRRHRTRAGVAAPPSPRPRSGHAAVRRRYVAGATPPPLPCRYRGHSYAAAALAASPPLRRHLRPRCLAPTATVATSLPSRRRRWCHAGAATVLPQLPRLRRRGRRADGVALPPPWPYCRFQAATAAVGDAGASPPSRSVRRGRAAAVKLSEQPFQCFGKAIPRAAAARPPPGLPVLG